MFCLLNLYSHAKIHHYYIKTFKHQHVVNEKEYKLITNVLKINQKYLIFIKILLRNDTGHRKIYKKCITQNIKNI